MLGSGLGRRARSSTRSSTSTPMTPSSAIGSSPTSSSEPATGRRAAGVAAVLAAAGLVDHHQARAAATGKTPGPAVHDDLVQRDFTAPAPERGVADRHHRAPDRRGQALLLRDQGRVLEPDRRLRHRRADDRRAGRPARCGPRSPDANRPAPWSFTPTAAANFDPEPSGPSSKPPGCTGSMGRVAAAGDNAAMESFYSLLQKNVLDRTTLEDPQRARLRDRLLDRTHLQPPPTSTSTRQTHPRRVRTRLHHHPADQAA